MSRRGFLYNLSKKELIEGLKESEQLVDVYLRLLSKIAYDEGGLVISVNGLQNMPPGRLDVTQRDDGCIAVQWIGMAEVRHSTDGKLPEFEGVIKEPETRIVRPQAQIQPAKVKNPFIK